MLITTHYMEEADKLCDRIAIVDHGKLVALDTPIALKASMPEANVVEVQFTNESPDWPERLERLGRRDFSEAAERGHLSRDHFGGLDDYDAAGRDGGGAARPDQVAERAEHDA